MNVHLQTRLLLAFAVLLTLAGCESLTVDTQSIFSQRFMRSELVGLVAGFGTTFAAVPDLIAMLRQKSTQGMNPRISAIMGSFQIFWIWYGLLIVSRPVVLWNLIGVLTNCICVSAYFYFSRAAAQRNRDTSA